MKKLLFLSLTITIAFMSLSSTAMAAPKRGVIKRVFTIIPPRCSPNNSRLCSTTPIRITGYFQLDKGRRVRKDGKIVIYTRFTLYTKSARQAKTKRLGVVLKKGLKVCNVGLRTSSNTSSNVCFVLLNIRWNRKFFKMSYRLETKVIRAATSKTRSKTASTTSSWDSTPAVLSFTTTRRYP